MKKAKLISFLFGALFCVTGLTLAACGDKEPETSSTSIVQEEEPKGEEEAAHVHVWGDPTWTWTKEDNVYKASATFTCTLDPTHTQTVEATVEQTGSVKRASDCTHEGTITYTASVSFNNNSYTNSKDYSIAPNGHHVDNAWTHNEAYHWHECSDCDDKIDKEAHVIAVREEFQASTCQERGWKKEIQYCTICQRELSTSTITYGYGPHKYVKDETASYDPTCAVPGQLVQRCSECGNTIVTPIPATGNHRYAPGDQERTCAHSRTCLDCGAVQEALEHDYELHSHTDATCEDPGVDVYKCKHCDSQFNIAIPATGHHYDECTNWVERYEPTSNDCEYDVYMDGSVTCTEQGCDHVEELHTHKGTTMRHTYVATVVSNPTCTHPGSNKYVCSVCGDVKKDEYDEIVTTEIPVNPDNHVWDDDPDHDGVYHCLETGCTATKTVLAASSSGSMSVTGSQLNTDQDIVDIDLKNVSLQLDETTKNALKEQANLDISATECTGATLPAGVQKPAELTDDAKVYNFEISTGSDTISTFGEDGAIAVRIPYTLGANEDPEAIVIWHLKNDGTIEKVNAQFVSDNPANPAVRTGYVTFNTTHFSCFTVAQLSAQERCEAFGHRYGEDIVVAPTCLQAGYTYHVCSVCGNKQVFDEKPATGHHFEHCESCSQAATCTQDGYYDEECVYCHVHRGEIVGATGHDYQFVSRVEPTCSLPGTARYECSHCHDVKVVSIPAKGHTYELEDIEAATCTHDGLRAYKCTDCHQEDPTKGHIVVPALGHNYEEVSDNEEETTYECSRCHDEHIVHKVSVAFTQQVAKDSNFYVNAAKSIVGNDITVKLNNSHFHLDMPDGMSLKLSGDDAELHIGLDAKNKLVAYGKATFGYENVNSHDVTKMSGKAAFYLENGKIYVKLYNDSTSSNTYYYYDLSYVNMGGGDNPVTLGQVLDKVPDIVDFIDKDVTPYVDKLLNANKDAINDFGYHLFETFLSVKSTPDGYMFSVDINKLCNVVSMLTDDTTTIKAFLDTIIGEGNTDKLLDNVRDLTLLPLDEALAKIKQDTGIDYKELLALIDKGVARFSEYDSLRDLLYENMHIDINEYLSDAYLKNHSIVSIVKENENMARMFGDGTIATFIDQQIRSMLDMTFVDLLENFMGPDMTNSIKGMVDHYIDLVRANASGLKFYALTDTEGNVQKLAMDVALSETDLFDVKLDISVEFGEYYSLFNYQDIVNFVDRNLNHIYNENFSSDAQIEEYFSSSQSIAFFKKDANNHIEEVKTYQIGNMSYGGSTNISNERDLIKYAGRSYYNELFTLYQDYKSKGLSMTVVDGTSVREECINGFVPVSLTMEEGCSDDFEVKYSLPASEKYVYGGYDSVAVIAYNASNNQYVDIKLLQNYPYSYRGTFVGGLATNATSGEFKDEVREHDWVEISTSPAVIHCGDRVTKTYQCSDCGKTKTETFIQDHTDAHETGRHFKHAVSEEQHQSCYEGIILEYHCDACNEDFQEEVYRHLYTYKETFNVKCGKKKYVVHIGDCFCGEHIDALIIEGLERYNTYNHFDDKNEYDYSYEQFRNYQTDETVYAGIYYKQLKNECKAERFLRFYDSKGEVLESISLGKVNRHLNTELLYSGLKYDSVSDKYTCISHCEDCNRDEVVTLNPNDWGKGFAIKGKELGFTSSSDRNRTVVYVSGRIKELVDGVAEYVSLWSLPSYENLQYGGYTYDETTKTYTYQYRGPWNPDNGTYGESQYKFMYTRQEDQEQHAGGCKYYEGDLLKLYKIKGGTPAFTIFEKHRQATYRHNNTILNSDVYHFDDLHIDVSVDELECQYCGKESSDIRYIINSPEYTGPREVVDGDWVYSYPTHYYPELELTLDGCYSAYNKETGERIVIQSYLENGTSYDKDGQESLSLNFRNDKYTYINFNNQEYTKEYKSTSKTGRQAEESYWDERIETYYYSFESGFAAKYEEVTHMPYDGLELGCIRFLKSEWRGSYETEPHVEYRFNLDDKYGEYYQGENVHYGNIVPNSQNGPSCSQFGYGTCSVCGQQVAMDPLGHKDNGHDACERCDTHALNGYYSGYGLVLEDISDANNIKIGYAYNLGGRYDNDSVAELGYDVNIYFYEDGIPNYYSPDPEFVWLSSLSGYDQYDGLNHRYVYSIAGLQATLVSMELDDNVNANSEFEVCFSKPTGDGLGTERHSIKFTATELGLYTPAP